MPVSEIFTLGWGDGEDGWQWYRILLAWKEEQMGECSLLLSNIFLRDGVEDKWDKSLVLGKGYSVQGAYHLLSYVA